MSLSVCVLIKNNQNEISTYTDLHMRKVGNFQKEKVTAKEEKIVLLLIPNRNVKVGKLMSPFASGMLFSVNTYPGLDNKDNS